MCSSTILNELKDLVNQIGNEQCRPSPPCCTGPCSTPCTFPFAQVTMTCPPPILAPTRPEPVKPLKLPCPEPPPTPLLTPLERESMRYDNFYNNYNVDFRHPGCPSDYDDKLCTPEKQCGQTLDGKSPCCDDNCHKKIKKGPKPGCPTGFKPCTMKLTPPPCCDPNGVWCAEVQPCPPKRNKCPVFEVGAAYEKKKCDK